MPDKFYPDWLGEADQRLYDDFDEINGREPNEQELAEFKEIYINNLENPEE
jgi:hypothetical protein